MAGMLRVPSGISLWIRKLQFFNSSRVTSASWYYHHYHFITNKTIFDFLSFFHQKFSFLSFWADKNRFRIYKKRWHLAPAGTHISRARHKTSISFRDDCRRQVAASPDSRCRLFFFLFRLLCMPLAVYSLGIPRFALPSFAHSAKPEICALKKFSNYKFFMKF